MQWKINIKTLIGGGCRDRHLDRILDAIKILFQSALAQLPPSVGDGWVKFDA